MSDESFRITRQQVALVLTWVGYIEQARIAQELEGSGGHEALCYALQKAADSIFQVISELPSA
jgi:hypothetical protein